MTHEVRFGFRRVGELGMLIEFTGGSSTRHRVTGWLDAHRHRPRMQEVVPATSTVYVASTPDVLADLVADLSGVGWTTGVLPRPTGPPRTVVVEVRYDGPDLAEVAAAIGRTPDEVVALHTSVSFPVEFFGFAPGQAFIGELPRELRVPRRPTPRVRVPPGAVGIANEFTTIYPDAAPGGWSLLGKRVSPPLWDERASPPNQVAVGDRIRFRAAR
jgi:KipI family sensor histidine kinase inhibitor